MDKEQIYHLIDLLYLNMRQSKAMLSDKKQATSIAYDEALILKLKEML